MAKSQKKSNKEVRKPKKECDNDDEPKVRAPMKFSPSVPVKFSPSDGEENPGFFYF